jgi:hypothetical protein
VRNLSQLASNNRESLPLWSGNFACAHGPSCVASGCVGLLDRVGVARRLTTCVALGLDERVGNDNLSTWERLPGHSYFQKVSRSTSTY